MKYKKFEELPIWQLALSITKIVYDFSSSSVWSKDFALKDQIRRAIISVSSNIVEGFEKSNNNEFIRYLRIAKGSTGEVRNQFYIALVNNYLKKSEFEHVNSQLERLAGEIGGLINYLEEHRRLKK